MAPRKKAAHRPPIPIERKKELVNDVNLLEFHAKGMGDTRSDQYVFVLVNPNDFDSNSKFYIKEILETYKKELPAMIYAANTGKESTFMENCVSNGKYCTLILKSALVADPGLIIAAITYQIVPADTQYAEIPLAAVSSTHQHKGFGRTLFMELKKRLQSVGIRTIFCWGDKESEGFWFKQGFVSIAEVDTKGKARRMPIRADIRRALCFPGSSTLMVSHINQGITMSSVDFPEFCSSLKPDGKFSSDAPHKQTAVSEQNSKASNAVELETYESFNFQAKEFVAPHVGENKICDLDNQDPAHVSNGPVSFAETENYWTPRTAEQSNTTGEVDERHCSCSTQRSKRVWEASLSSLKSKKIKGVQVSHLQLESNQNLSPKSNGCDIYSQACSLGTSKHETLAGVSLKNHSTNKYPEKFPEEFGYDNVASECLVGKKHPTLGKSFKIMLMNIADEAKKNQLMKVIEELGGSLTSDGSASTHVITGKVRKTLNFCTALCSGAWIVSPHWLKESYREGRFLEELPYILKDDDYLSKYRADFNAVVLRAKACPGSLFEGYDFCVSAHAQPPPKTLSMIVKSAGGNVIRGLDTVKEVSKTIFLACEEDVEEALMAVKKGIWTFSSEWLMNCVMRQELDLGAPQFAESL